MGLGVVLGLVLGLGSGLGSGLGLGLGLTRPWRLYLLLTAYQAVATLLTTDCLPGRGDVVESEVRVRGVLWVVDPRQPRQVDAAWEG